MLYMYVIRVSLNKQNKKIQEYNNMSNIITNTLNFTS